MRKSRPFVWYDTLLVLVLLCLSSHGQALRNLNGIGTNTTIYNGLTLTNTGGTATITNLGPMLIRVGADAFGSGFGVVDTNGTTRIQLQGQYINLIDTNGNVSVQISPVFWAIGNGVTVCSRWRDSFLNFLEDMGHKPPGTSIDRWPNKAGNYEPGNCRWATPKQQSRNRKNNHVETAFGVTACLSELCELHGVRLDQVQNRLRWGWNIEDALTKKFIRRFTKDEVSEIKRLSATMTTRDIAAKYGMSYGAIYAVVKRANHTDLG